MTRSARSVTTSAVDVRGFLLQQDQSWLVDQLLRAAEENALLAARLEVMAGGSRSEAFDLSGLQRDLASTIEPLKFSVAGWMSRCCGESETSTGGGALSVGGTPR